MWVSSTLQDRRSVSKSPNLCKGVHRPLWSSKLVFVVCTDKVPASSDFIRYNVCGGTIDPPTQGDTYTCETYMLILAVSGTKERRLVARLAYHFMLPVS